MDVRIVVVDDDPSNVELLRRMLDRAGHCGVLTTSDPAEAIELCVGTPADLLLLDLHMQGTDGYEVMKAVLGRVEALPIIVVTGDASGQTAERALQAGAASVLVKPFDYGDMLIQVSEQLGRRR